MIFRYEITVYSRYNKKKSIAVMESKLPFRPCVDDVILLSSYKGDGDKEYRYLNSNVKKIIYSPHGGVIRVHLGNISIQNPIAGISMESNGWLFTELES